MTTCKYVYLDVDGKPSSVYYDTLKKHGQEAAERAYVNYMLGTGAKFSTETREGRTPPEDIIAESERLRLTRDESRYVDVTSKKEYERITTVVKNLIEVPNEMRTGRMPKPAFDEIAISERVAKKEIEDLVISSSDNTVTREDPEKLEKAYNKYLQDHPEVTVADKAAIIRDRWKASAEWGDFFHAVFQEFFTIHQDKEFTDYSDNAKIGMAINKVKERFPDLDPDRKLGSGIAGSIHKVISLIDKIKKQEAIQYGEEQTFTIVPELRLRSSNLEKNVAGTADLVLFSTSGNAYVIDFKSKSEESARHMFRTSVNKFGGPFTNESLDDNKANEARVQTAYYAAILEEYGYRVPNTYTVMIEGELQRNAIDNSWKYVGIKLVEPIQNSPIHHLLVGNAADNQERLTKLRESGIDGFIQEIATEGDNHNVSYVNESEERAVKKRMLDILTDKQGRRFILRDNPMLTRDEREYYIDGESPETIEQTLRNDFRIAKQERMFVANDVIQFFENEGITYGQNKLAGREKVVGELLRGISKHTHTLMRADRYPGITDAGPDVLIAVNKSTGAVSLLSVITASKTSIKFGDNPKVKRNSIFGKYATNRAISLEKAESEILEQTSIHDFHALKLGLIALKLKNRSERPLLIENMKVATVAAGNAGQVTSTYTKKEIHKIQLLYKYLPQDVKDKFKFVGDLLSKPSNTLDASYGLDTVELVKNMILDGVGSIKMATTSTEIGRVLSEKMKNWAQGQLVPPSLISDLLKFRSELTSIKRNKKEPIEGDPTILAIDKAIVQLSKFDIYSKQLIRDRFSKSFVRTAMTSGDVLTERAQVLYNNASAKIRDEFKAFDLDHKELLQNFLNESKRFGYDTSEKAFKSIFVDPSFTDGNHENWMKLLSENDPTLDSRPAAKAYIKFFNDTVTAQFKRSMSSAQFKRVESGTTWTRGMIPIVRANKKLTDAKSWKSYDAWVDSLKSNIKAMEKPSFDPQLSNTHELQKMHELMEHFNSQATSEGPRNRNDMMGIESTQKVVPSRDLEMNLAAVLNNMVITASEGEHMGNTLAVVDISLMNVLDELQKSNPDIDVKSTKEFLQAWTSMVINHKYKKEDKEDDVIPKVADTLSKSASTAYFTLSLKQATTEFLTGTFQTGSAMIANVITGALSKGEQVRFYPQDVAWAASCLDGKFDVNMQTKAFQITYDLGMTYADPAQLKQKEFYDTGKAKLFRSKPGFYLNQLFFNASITNTALAEMRHKKIDRAYVNEGTAEKPDWKYDETLDERFYVYDPDGKSFGSNMKTTPPSTEEEKKKHALWKAVKKDLYEEGMVADNGRMKLPLTANERTSIKYYATKLYGSFNKDKTKTEEMTVVGRSMLRYKDWFAQRIANYYTPADMSIARGKFEWVADPELEDGGVMQWKGIPNEGIIQSLHAMFKELAEHGKISKPTDVQLENIGKLLADILLLLLMCWPIAAMTKDNKFLETKAGKSLTASYTNATSDIAIWKAASTMGDSLFPGVQMALTAGTDAARSLLALATGDSDQAMKTFVKVPRKIGGFNSYETMAELFNS